MKRLLHSRRSGGFFFARMGSRWRRIGSRSSGNHDINAERLWLGDCVRRSAHASDGRDIADLQCQHQGAWLLLRHRRYDTHL
jgi:hypothetical protein